MSDPASEFATLQTLIDKNAREIQRCRKLIAELRQCIHQKRQTHRADQKIVSLDHTEKAPGKKSSSVEREKQAC